jgi:nucleoid DNA-binding protein
MAAKKPATGSVRPLTSRALRKELAVASDLTQTQIAKFFDALTQLIQRELGKEGPGELTVAGLFKMRCFRKPPERARRGINPFTGQPVTIAGKPARVAVRFRPLKKLNDLVQ